MGYFIDCLVMTMMHLPHMASEPVGLVEATRDASISGSELFRVRYLLSQDDIRLQSSWAVMVRISNVVRLLLQVPLSEFILL